MDKFIVKRQSVSNVSFKPVQIRTNDFDALKQMQNDTGMNFVDLVHAMVVFCAERLEVVEE